MIGMVVRISRAEHSETRRLRLRVEGALTREGAQLLAQQCVPFIHDAEWSVEIDLAAVTFIDEAAAAVVSRLSQSPSVSLSGCQLFTQQMIEAVPSGRPRSAGTLPPASFIGHGEDGSDIDETPLRARRRPH
jgi:ABC-type transporter Mla MlaB component